MVRREINVTEGVSCIMSYVLLSVNYINSRSDARRLFHRRRKSSATRRCRSVLGLRLQFLPSPMYILNKQTFTAFYSTKNSNSNNVKEEDRPRMPQ